MLRAKQVVRLWHMETIQRTGLEWRATFPASDTAATFQCFIGNIIATRRSISLGPNRQSEERARNPFTELQQRGATKWRCPATIASKLTAKRPAKLELLSLVPVPRRPQLIRENLIRSKRMKPNLNSPCSHFSRSP